MDSGAFGFAQIGWWDFSSLSDRRQHGDGYRHKAFVEQDVVTDVEFRCPYITVSWFSRSNYWPRNDTSMTLGFFRPLELGYGFSLIPGFLLDGGNHKWVNQRHAAHLGGETIHSGFTSMSFHLELQYRVSDWCRLRAGCRQMDIFDWRARRSVDNSGQYWLHNDYSDVFFGVACVF